MGKLCFLSCLFTLIASYQQAPKMGFIRGFIQQEAVYEVPKEKALYTYNGSWKKIATRPDKYEVIQVTDSFTCYHSNGSNKDTLVYNYNNGKKEVFVRSGLNWLIVGTDGRTCYRDKANGKNIQYKKGETVANLKIQGYPMEIVGSHLYYYQYQAVPADPEDVRAKIYDLDLDKPAAAPVLILKNADGDRLKVSADRKYMLTGQTKSADGNDFFPLILDVKNQRISYIQIDDDKLGNAYYSPKDSAFVFYGFQTMEKQVLKPSKLKYIPVNK